MAEYQSLLQVVTEMEKLNAQEELLRHEEERKHEATKQELQKVTQALERKTIELIQAQEQTSKVLTEKNMQDHTLAEYQKSNAALREQLEGLKGKLETLTRESSHEKERFVSNLSSVNDKYRQAMRLLNELNLQPQAPQQPAQGDPMPPPPSQPGKKDSALIACQLKLKEKEEECAQSLQELLKLDEFCKTLEKSIEEQTAYINQLQDNNVCPKCGYEITIGGEAEVTTPMDIATTE